MNKDRKDLHDRLREKMTLSKTKKLIYISYIVFFVLFVAWSILDSAILLVVGLLFGALMIAINYAFWRCPHCGRHLGRDSGEYCTHCGQKLEK